MRIPINRNSSIPIYQQIAEHLRQSLRSGKLPPETRLPASRTLANALGVSRLTIENAYANLEAEGLIYSHQGSGTYVAPPLTILALPDLSNETSWPEWQRGGFLAPRLPEYPEPLTLLQSSQQPDPINFSKGTGDIGQFPAQEFRKLIQQILRKDDVSTYDYGDPRGYTPLRETIAQVVASQGLGLHNKNILITSGSQQALSLACQALLQAGDWVLVEKPTYAGMLDLLHLHGARAVGIPMDEDGLQINALEDLLKQYHPKLIYSMPTFHNPSGINLSGERRRQLVALADEYNLPIIEDDFVGDLRYAGRAQPALKAFDPGGRVIYVSTFSKMLVPGLRVGFLAAEGPIYEQLVETKRVTDVASANLIQRTLEAYVTIGRYQASLRRACQRYHRRRDTMLQAIQDYLPEDIQFIPPKGGLFVWLQLPLGISSEDLLPLACQQGVSFMPGTRFYPDPTEGDSYIRLNFACQMPERIEEGIKRLGKTISTF